MADIVLPFHCPVLRSDHLKRPCEVNLARLKALKASYLHVGPLEKCGECRGEKLIIREIPEEDMAVQVSVAEAERILGPEKLSQVMGIGKDEHRLETCATEAPEHPPEAVRGLIRGQYCKNHPERLAYRNKNGVYMGLCRECLKERASSNAAIRRANNEARKEIPPGPPLAKGGEGQELMMKPLSPEQIAQGRAAVRALGERHKKSSVGPSIGHPEAPLGEIAPGFACKNHPERPAVIDKLGRNMRLCLECLQERGRKAAVLAQSRGTTGPPVAIPLNTGKYEDLKAWLEAQAEENERTLNQEIMYRLKQARSIWEQGRG